MLSFILSPLKVFFAFAAKVANNLGKSQLFAKKKKFFLFQKTKDNIIQKAGFLLLIHD